MSDRDKDTDGWYEGVDDKPYQALVKALQRAAVAVTEQIQAAEECAIPCRILDSTIIRGASNTAWLVCTLNEGHGVYLLHGYHTLGNLRQFVESEDVGIEIRTVPLEKRVMPHLDLALQLDRRIHDRCRCGHMLSERSQKGAFGMPIHYCPSCGWTDHNPETWGEA